MAPSMLRETPKIYACRFCGHAFGRTRRFFNEAVRCPRCLSSRVVWTAFSWRWRP
jgi:predicted Zn-ribbon and HTH transcriptional regulator